VYPSERKHRRTIMVSFNNNNTLFNNIVNEITYLDISTPTRNTTQSINTPPPPPRLTRSRATVTHLTDEETDEESDYILSPPRLTRSTANVLANEENIAEIEPLEIYNNVIRTLDFSDLSDHEDLDDESWNPSDEEEEDLDGYSTDDSSYVEQSPASEYMILCAELQNDGYTTEEMSDSSLEDDSDYEP
jgi:hypothetical protein